MSHVKCILWLTLSLVASNAAAYGSSSSSKKACKAPRFSDFNPPHLSEVKPGADFSFDVSSSVDPESIEVSAKKQKIAVDIDSSGGSYRVSGRLPSELKGTHARINIKAKGTNRCQGSDGWLLKIAD